MSAPKGVFASAVQLEIEAAPGLEAAAGRLSRAISQDGPTKEAALRLVGEVVTVCADYGPIKLTLRISPKR